jgi:hypothetical protein
MLAVSLAQLSNPPIALARPHPLSIYIVLLANAITYASVGLVIETMRRPARQPLKV